MARNDEPPEHPGGEAAPRAEDDEDQPEDAGNPLQSYVRYTHLGLSLAATVGLAIAAGYGLDYWAGTERPWFTIAFAVIGIIGALVNLIRQFR